MTRRTHTVLERSLAGLLAALTLLIWPAALWHEVTTVHRVCPEHGELVDAGTPECAPSESSEHGPRLSGASERDGEHEHCPFVTLGSPTTPEAGPRDAGVWLAEIRGVRSSGSEARHLAIPILLQAPKQSPPV